MVGSIISALSQDCGSGFGVWRSQSDELQIGGALWLSVILYMERFYLMLIRRLLVLLLMRRLCIQLWMELPIFTVLYWMLVKVGEASKIKFNKKAPQLHHESA